MQSKKKELLFSFENLICDIEHFLCYRPLGLVKMLSDIHYGCLKKERELEFEFM